MKEGLVRYHYHVIRDTWNIRMKSSGETALTGGAEGEKNSQAKGTGLDNTLENNGRDCTEEVTYLPYTRRLVSNLSGERTEADKK